MDVIRGYSPEQFTKELCTHLQQMGIDAEVVPPGSPEEVGAPHARLLGCVKVKGLNFDMVQSTSWLHSTPETTTTYFGLRFLVMGKVNGLEQQLKAEAKMKKKGFIRRKLVDVTWEGGRLADLLNRDTQVNDQLIKANKMLGIAVDLENRNVRLYIVIGSDERALLGRIKWEFPSKAYVDACDSIAHHIRSLGV